MGGERDAVEALERLGLTEYEARCFVGLVRISQGTAKETSRVADIPRSRVYDTLDRLHDRGLVDVQESDPREYRAVEFDEALGLLRRGYESNIETARSAMADVETVETEEDQGVWAVASQDHVLDRITAVCEDAEDEIHYLFADTVTPKDVVLDRLAAAVDRGVAVAVEVPTEDVRDRVRDAVPGATVMVAPGLDCTSRVVHKRPGQLVMVDEQDIVATGVEEGDLPGFERETAVWTSGKDHGFATWTRELLTDRFDG